MRERQGILTTTPTCVYVQTASNIEHVSELHIMHIIRIYVYLKDRASIWEIGYIF